MVVSWREKEGTKRVACRLLCSITHWYASHLRPAMLFYLLSEAFLLESVSEQGQCSLRLLFLLICRPHSGLSQKIFPPVLFKEDFTHAFHLPHPQPTPNLIYQSNFLSRLQTRANVKNAMFLSSVNVKGPFSDMFGT